MAEEGKAGPENRNAEERGSSIATAVLAGIAVAILEPELLPGVAIGVGAMLAPKLVPRLSAGLRPLVKTAVKASYAAAAKTREIAAEASEQVQDIMAEARAEQESGAPAKPVSQQRPATKRRAKGAS